MLERLTPGAAECIVRAQDSARRAHRASITALDLVVGMARSHASDAGRLLREAGADLSGVEVAARRLARQSVASPEHIPLGSSGVRAVRAAVSAADEAGRDFVGSRQLLLALIADARDGHAEAFARVGVSARHLAELARGAEDIELYGSHLHAPAPPPEAGA